MSKPRGNLGKYRSSNPLQQFFIRRFLLTVREFYQALPQGALCEVGCGEGFVLRYLLDRGALKQTSVTGVEIDEEAIKFASAFIPEVNIVKASVYALPFPDKQFQSVMMLEVLEHLETPGKALQEISRAGNYLLLSVPYEPWFRIANFMRGKNWARWGNDEEHIQAWGQRSFKKLLAPYGTLLRFKVSFPWIVALLKTA